MRRTVRPSLLHGIPYLGTCKFSEVVTERGQDKYAVTQMFIANFDGDLDTADGATVVSASSSSPLSKSTTSALSRANSGTITPPLAVRLSHSAFGPHSGTYGTFLGSTSNGSKGADGGLDNFAPAYRS